MNKRKTTRAVNLAITLVQIRKRIRPVDRNAKSLNIHYDFKLYKDPGVSCFIIGNSSWKDAGRLP